MDQDAGKMHVIELTDPILIAEDGLMIGNGDLSMSFYQSATSLIWRLGKGDVWDRRLDTSDDPKPPVHIDEVARGIQEEGWKCGPYGGPVEALRGAKDPQRMKEVCQGCSPSYKHRPFPCPKPVGELSLRLPLDLHGLKIRQRLTIERGILEVSCKWDEGVELEFECFIPPEPNVLVVNWKLRGWEDQDRFSPKRFVWFSLYRWADPTIDKFAACFRADALTDWGGTYGYVNPKSTPLAPPHWAADQGLCFIEQTFAPEATFPDGFAYRMVPSATDFDISPAATHPTREARLHLMPKDKGKTSGSVVVAVPTSSDEGGLRAGMIRVKDMLEGKHEQTVAAWRTATVQSAEAFWSRSSVRAGDAVIEDTWYEILHARRCAYRHDRVPPGLNFPSSLADYTHWHGDYHWNFNTQSPFWGDYAANHFDTGDAYFQAMKFMLHIGRKIARDFLGCRGTFITLSGYPMLMEDDPMPVVPMGRMAYMTGWAAHQYWWRYLYSMDKDWLARDGYEVLRDCALFYTDFMKKRGDGLYHAYPSNQGEDGFTGSAADYTDRPMVMRHMRYCLRCAIAAAEVLDRDQELRAQWGEILDHSAPYAGGSPEELPGIPRGRVEALAPEFYSMYDERPCVGGKDASPWADRTTDLWRWFGGKVPWTWMIHMRNGVFQGGRDWPHVRELIRRWRRPNGLLQAYSMGFFGNTGGWTETTGILGPLQEMMLQSWTGVIEVFPAWPRQIDGSFRTLRAQGAFLVSATWSNEALQSLEIQSERGLKCRLRCPWPEGASITGSSGRSVPVRVEGGLAVFETQPGGVYSIKCAASA